MSDEFSVHKLNPAGLAAASHMAAAFDTLLKEAKFHVPACRELSLAVTTLQEAAFWVKRGIAVQPCNQE